jgi:plasmid stabilization system protein ParE
MEVIWTDDAEADLIENLNYLIKEWSEKSASNLIKEIDAVIEMIQLNTELYTLTEIPSVRKAVIRKQISLYYKIDGSKLYVLRIWNNYKNPDFLRV